MVHSIGGQDVPEPLKGCMVLAGSWDEDVEVFVGLWKEVVRVAVVGCQFTGSLSERRPPVYSRERVLWGYEGFVFGGAVAVHGLGLPGEALSGVVLFGIGVRGYVLDVVESAAAAELVSEGGCCVFGCCAVDWVGCGSFEGVYDGHGGHDRATSVGV